MEGETERWMDGWICFVLFFSGWDIKTIFSAILSSGLCDLVVFFQTAAGCPFLKKNNAGGLALSHFEAYYKFTVIWRMWHWHQNGQTDHWNRWRVQKPTVHVCYNDFWQKQKSKLVGGGLLGWQDEDFCRGAPSENYLRNNYLKSPEMILRALQHIHFFL